MYRLHLLHPQHKSRYAEVIARQLGVAASRALTLRGAAKLHDFGKVAIPDRILLKPGPLTPAERCVVERHTVVGHELLRDSGSELLDIAAVIALSHHERWDGSGYPQGLGRDEIPLEARIATLADFFDSLTRERPYRPAVKVAHALQLVRAGRGVQFDPDVVDAFFAAQAEIRRTRKSERAAKTL
jgi:HD-GYP domain-containing protein (c-di-GMP phosphodiesterase class II)